MRLRRPAILALVLTAARVTAYAVGRPSAGVANRAYLLALGAICLTTLVSAIGRRTTEPSLTAFDAAARPPASETERPARLLALEDLAAFGADKAQGAHFHLRPYLRELLRDRLAARSIDLDTDPRARELLGPQVWELVRPARPAPPDGRAHGLRPQTVTEIADTLERLP